MSSRRPMTRSYSEGRSSSHNGDDVSGTSRTSSCSYLSSVRPENSQSSHRYSQYRPSRSTLFSVMAHLIEETQPLFETTLKSRAVSETSNVKFTCVVSGYPAPEVTWYKDDTQLDRYCGLPKYKVCRDGMDHSLYIYNCTEEDAAIYQASAKNSKGIVSCSGVLEVGTMSEYKIHQQYFAKLKQKAENKRRALEESKENHGPGPQEELRTISPERSQRKRRSPMETSLSAPSSMEDEVAEVNTPALVPAAEARLQQTAMDGEDKPVPTTNGAAPHIPNGQDIKENGSKGTYVYDSTQKTFVAHPPKAPFAKKKIKISNGVESVKGDSLAEMASEERGTSGGASAAHCQTDSLHTQGSVDEVMEVESSAPDPVKEAEQEEKASNAGVSVGIEKVQMEGKLHAPSHKEHPLDLSATPDVPSPTKDISGTKSKNGVEREKVLEVEPKNIVGCQVVNLAISSQSKPSSSIANTVEIKSHPEDVTVMEVEVKPLAPQLTQKPSALGSMKRTSTLVNKAKVAVKDSATVGALSSDVSINGSTLSRAAESTATPRDRETVLPQRLRACEPSGDQLSGKETSSSTKNVCVSALQGEVTQADTQTGRNDAPVDLKPLATRSELDVRLPQRPPRERGAMTDADQTPTLHSASQPASDDMTHATWDHSRGSNESHTVPSTELLKSPLESPGDSDNKSGCSVSPTLQQGQVEIAIKTVVGTEIPVDKNVQGNEIGEQQVQIGNFASVGREIDIDTVGSLSRIHQDDIKRMDAAEKKKIEINKVLDVKMEKNGQVVLKTLPLNLNVEAVTDKSQIAATTSIPNLNISAQETQDLNVVPTSSPVMSIAEILRAQIKALASTVSSSATPVQPVHVPNQHVDHQPSPEIQSSGQASEMRMEETDYSKDSGKPKLEKEIDTNIGSISNVVLRLDNVEPHSCTESELLQSSNIVSPAVETLPNKFVIPPISIIDIENTFKNRTPIIVKDNESVMDTGQEYGTSLCAPLENSLDSLTGKNSVDSSLITTSTLPVKISQEHTQVQGNTTEEMDSSWSVPLKVSSQHNIVSLPQESSKTISSLPCDRKNHSVTQRPEFPLNRTPTVPLVTEVKNAQPDSAMLLEPLEEHTLVVPQRNSQIMLDTQAALDTETPDVPAPINQLDRSTSSKIKVEDYSKTDPLIPASNTDESPLLRKKENTSPIPSATPQELALGARRKIFLPKPRGEETEATPPADSQPQREEVLKKGSRLSPENPSMSPSLSRKIALLQPPSGQSTPPAERRSPLLGRRKVAAGAPEQIQEPALGTEITRTEQKPALEITRTEQKPALEITRTEHKPALEITRTEQKPALEITRTEQKPALEITRTEQKPALGTEITRTEHKPALEITRTEQKPALEITRTEQKPALSTEITRTEHKPALEITRTEQKPALSTEITRTEQKPALGTEFTRTEQKPALEITRTEQKPALSTEITRTEHKPALGTEITRTEQKPALEITRTEQKPALEITRTEQKPALEITRTEQKPALEITRTEQKPALEITRTEQKPALEITRTEQKPALGTEITRTEQKPALEITRTEQKPDDKDKHKQFKAPQVIRKIRAELFSDASGHLKLWCQFFNVLSDSTVKWYRDEVEISEVKKSAEDETQVALAIVQPSSRDCGVYGCTITNEYGTDSTDFLLSVDILRSMFLREEPAVGEEIEMTPLLFNKGVADSGLWGNKLFGRIMMMESHVGEGCSHKACRVKVIYGLEPLFESGSSSVIKVRSPIAYGGKGESSLVERNLEITQLDCRLQNIAREYCKIFAAETRVIENFGPTLEVIPLYLMYRPANAVPHATVEAALQGVYLSYCLLDASGSLVMRTGSEVEQKCCALQHWIHQWTNGNLLLTRLEGVDTKITNVGMSIKSKGYQGLTPTGNPRVFEQFISQHQCNYYCGLLKLRTMKPMDSLTPAKPKGSRSPLLQRKTASGSSSPQTSRRATTSPRVSRKSESEDSKATSTQKGGEAPKSDG